nr:Uncharacterised protein [Klebsiella pneumoniae]
MMILLHGKRSYDHSGFECKIDAELKEKLRHYAEVNNENPERQRKSCCSWLFSWRSQQVRRG